jgi:capsular polysaccharide export protein
VFSRGIAQIQNLAAFLPETRSIVRVRGRLPRRVDSVAGWGMKPTSERARRLAGRRGLPYLALEEASSARSGRPLRATSR